MNMGAGVELLGCTTTHWKQCFSENGNWMANCCDREGEFKDEVTRGGSDYRTYMLSLLALKKKIQTTQERRKMIMTRYASDSKLAVSPGIQHLVQCNEQGVNFTEHGMDSFIDVLKQMQNELFDTSTIEVAKERYSKR